MDKGVSGLQNVRSLKWCAEIGLTADWSFLCGFPGEEPAEYARLADLVPSLAHLPPPIGPYQIRVDRFSPYFVAPEAHGLVERARERRLRPRLPLRARGPGRLAYYFDYDYADGRTRRSTRRR